MTLDEAKSMVISIYPDAYVITWEDGTNIVYEYESYENADKYCARSLGWSKNEDQAWIHSAEWLSWVMLHKLES